MKKYIITSLITILSLNISSQSFKQKQKKYKRVRSAYTQKIDKVNKTYSKSYSDIYLVAYKNEGDFEVWAKDIKSNQYKLLTTYPICSKSGKPGPKRKEGDLQVPEGFYRITHYNPWSNFHLSMLINYPNRSDKILSNKKRPGGSICIHGDCVTIGCIPLTDDKIKELYIMCIEAIERGQKSIPVTIYPARLTDSNYSKLLTKHKNKPYLSLWKDLKQAYSIFSKEKRLPKIFFRSDGRHTVK